MLEQEYEENGARILTEVQGRSLGDNGHKVKQGKSVLHQEMLVCDDPSREGIQTL